jgi:hypothetical protein
MASIRLHVQMVLFLLPSLVHFSFDAAPARSVLPFSLCNVLLGWCNTDQALDLVACCSPHTASHTRLAHPPCSWLSSPVASCIQHTCQAVELLRWRGCGRAGAVARGVAVILLELVVPGLAAHRLACLCHESVSVESSA